MAGVFRTHNEMQETHGGEGGGAVRLAPLTSLENRAWETRVWKDGDAVPLSGAVATNRSHQSRTGVTAAAACSFSRTFCRTVSRTRGGNPWHEAALLTHPCRDHQL